MIYPVYAIGNPVLRQKAEPVEINDELKQLVEDMFETMYNANGVGLAAPQIGKNIRVFVVDAEPMDEENLQGFKKAFINAEKIEETGNEWAYEEGCLSIPDIHENVMRPEKITLKYQDEQGNQHTETFEGMAARVIQHEYDHIEGILFVDLIAPVRKQMLKPKLVGISKGRATAKYKMKFKN